MKLHAQFLSRRRMLEIAIGGGLTVFGGAVFAQQAKRLIETPEVAMGPFYPMLKPLDTDADLTRLAGNKNRAEGAIVHVTGRVLNLQGEVVPRAKIEIWQANTYGRYAHSSDPNRAPLDPNFQGFGVVTTDRDGRYHFKTIKPGAYPVSPTAQRPPHIHFNIEGKANRLVSQMFFPDEPLNEKDALFLDLRARLDKNAAAVIAQPLPPTKEIESGAMLLNWDVVLLNG